MTFVYVVTYLPQNGKHPVIEVCKESALPGNITATDVRRAQRAAGRSIYSPTSQGWLTYIHVEDK